MLHLILGSVLMVPEVRACSIDPAMRHSDNVLGGLPCERHCDFDVKRGKNNSVKDTDQRIEKVHERIY